MKLSLNEEKPINYICYKGIIPLIDDKINNSFEEFVDSTVNNIES